VGTIRSHLVGAWFQMRGVIGHYLETTRGPYLDGFRPELTRTREMSLGNRSGHLPAE
jgi:hypothetical protein